MCGIAGIVGGNVEREALERMAGALCHRGPDDRGTARLLNGVAGLSHARLAVIDLSPAGHQPMSDPGGEVWVTFNGEIYNFTDLRDELSALGHAFVSASDTEVLIAAYRQWGKAFVSRLNGMFAFALFDIAARTLLLARDRAGEKPLFWWRDGDRLLFASELKALAAEPAFPRRIDLRSLDCYLAYGYSRPSSSLLQGISKLPPAHTLVFDLESRTTVIERYWDLPSDSSQGRSGDLVCALDEHLESAVRRQLTADVPVGILLSGGLDSSLIAAMAARVSDRRVKTFTVTFPGHASFDEGPRARLIAQQLGTDHTDLVASAETLELLPRLSRQFDDPIADHAMLPTYLVSRLLRDHATVALSGDGGDELFGGYAHYSWLIRQHVVKSRMPRAVRRLVGAASARCLPVGMPGRNHLAAWGGDALTAVNVYFDPLSRRRLAPVLAPLHTSWTAEQDKLDHAGDGTVLRRAQRADFRTTLSEGYLVKLDRASMLCSLETRAPFLDHRLVEFAFRSVPDRLKVDGEDRKILPRRLASKLLPGIDFTQKQGLTLPLGAWFGAGWGRFFEEVLAGSPFDRPAIASLFAGQRRGRNNASRLFALTMFELWRREYRATFE